MLFPNNKRINQFNNADAPQQVDQSDQEDENNEPKMIIALGTRRKSPAEIPLSSSIEPLDDNKDATTNKLPEQGCLARRESAKGVKLHNTPDCQDSTDDGDVGNFMHNIHSSPFFPKLSYTPPVYPKSAADAEFVSIALQRNFVFANALSDEDTSRKRELKQIVDAFEFYTVQEPGETILSAGSVGDYFYILKAGSIEYRKGGKVIGMAARPGQSFGELCLLYDCPPPADCISGPTEGVEAKAQQPCQDGSSCQLWRIHKLTFRQILALRTMRRDERMRDAIKKIKYFEKLDDEFVNRIADALVVRVVERGETLYEAGDAAEEFFVVGAEGQVTLTSTSGGKSSVFGPGDAFGEEAILSNALRGETATALEGTTLLAMSRDHLNRVIGSLKDAILLSQDRRLLKSVPLFRDSDFEDFEYELLAALIETVHYKGGKEIFLEEEIVEEPALYIVREGILDYLSEKYPNREKVLRGGDYFGEETLTPDKNMKFGGAKGGSKYHEATVEVVSDTAECGKLTLANIDSVILHLHRLGCKRRGSNYSPMARTESSGDEDPRPESLDDLEFHRLFGAGTFGRVWIVSRKGGTTAYALKIQSKRELLDQRQASGASRERSVMSKLDHPFVCKLVNTFQDANFIYLLLSFIQGGELLNLIQGGELYGGLPESAAKFYAAGMLEGLTYMHRRHIIYRDLKPENVLLDKDGYAVIVDFGFCEYSLRLFFLFSS